MAAGGGAAVLRRAHFLRCQADIQKYYRPSRMPFEIPIRLGLHVADILPSETQQLPTSQPHQKERQEHGREGDGA